MEKASQLLSGRFIMSRNSKRNGTAAMVSGDDYNKSQLVSSEEDNMNSTINELATKKVRDNYEFIKKARNNPTVK